MVLGSEEGVTTSAWKRDIVWGSLGDPHFSGGKAINNHRARTAVPARGLESSQDRQELSRRSLCPPALSPKGRSKPDADSTHLIP